MKTIGFCERRKGNSKQRETELQSELQELDHKLCNTDFGSLDSDFFAKYESAKKELRGSLSKSGPLHFGSDHRFLSNFAHESILV